MSFRNLSASIFVVLLLMCAVGGQTSSETSASSSSASSSKNGKKAGSAPKSPLDAGAVVNGVYRNSTLGFTCKIPPAWVLRTGEMNAPDAGGEKVDAVKSNTDAHGIVLLAAFSRPPEARAEDVNASILIAAEGVSSYPGLKDAAQYFGPVTEVAQAQGFEVAEDPYEFAIGTKPVVRGDFQKDVGSRLMRQSTLVMLAHGYAVSFTFIGGTEDEVEELIHSMSFTGAAKPPAGR